MVLTIIGFVVAYQFVSPAPPRRISIGTGSPEGAYYSYGKDYRKILSKDGITLDVRSTAGSADNLKLLEAESGGVDVAFVQGGMSALAKTDDLVSLGSLYFEPLWIFHRPDLEINRLSDLKGLRVAVGADGSGTKILSMQLLGLNGLSNKNTHIFSYGYQNAADMLLKGEIDVAMFVSTHRATYVLQLLRAKSLKLIGLERAEAYALRYHYLYVLKLPQGVIDFVANIPSRDLTLVAPTTQLVARSDLHPALIDLLLQAAEDVHESGGGFEREGEFPSLKYLDFKESEQAERFYESGAPFLQRYLPFWVATFLTRMKIMLLPLVVLLFPFFKLMPTVYRWRMRSRIYRWYSQLEAIDHRTLKADLAEQRDGYLSELDRLEENVSNVSVPPAFSEELYALRLHIDMLRNRLYKSRENEKG